MKHDHPPVVAHNWRATVDGASPSHWLRLSATTTANADPALRRPGRSERFGNRRRRCPLWDHQRSGGIGQAFSLTPPVSSGMPWTYTVLHSFAGADGALPTGVLAIGRGGVLYGVTHLGGGGNCYPEGCGVVYALIPPASSGGTWSFRVPYRLDRKSTRLNSSHLGISYAVFCL